MKFTFREHTSQYKTDLFGSMRVLQVPFIKGAVMSPVIFVKRVSSIAAFTLISVE